MNQIITERLYNLLPAIYRLRDATEGEVLRALLAVMENELAAIKEDIDGLYNDWFIETCQEWVVPYIGDLLGVRNLHAIGNFSQRAYVANTLAYRRRKGTATVLEQLARDVTGWQARAVEFFLLLATTQYLNHMRPANITTDLRDTDKLELLCSPFERTARTVDVRSIARNRGRYNIPNIGLFLWRLQSYPVTRSTARAASDTPDGRYTFSPLGNDIHLFNRPRTEDEITYLAEEINVSGILRRHPLYDELEARRNAIEPKTDYFGKEPVFEVFLNGQVKPLSPEEIIICNLSGWDKTTWKPPASKPYTRPDGQESRTVIAVDPVLGRLASLDGVTPVALGVSYAYGFSADIGGGPYNRQDSATYLDKPVTWQIGVTKDTKTLNDAPDPTQLVQTLQAAIEQWDAHAAKTQDAFGIIAIMDSSTYDKDLTIEIKAGSRLVIVAADWPIVDIADSHKEQRLTGQILPDGIRPHIKGNISVSGTSTGNTWGELILDGMLVEGKLTVMPGSLGRLHVAHCTLVPDKGGLVAEVLPDKQNSQLGISIYRSICGPITLSDTVPGLSIVDSIVDNDGGRAITAPGTRADIQTSTILGGSTMRKLDAGNSIFTGMVSVERRQEGCVRFSYVPDRSLTPRRYRCQPDLEIAGQVDEAERKAKASSTQLNQNQRDLIRARILDWLVPSFTSMRYGQPAYGQLHLTCPKQIKTGAEDGSEMGVFESLKQPQREANLRASLDEYLRFGLEAGIFYATYEDSKEEL